MNKDLVFKVSKVVVILSLFIVGFMAFLFKNPRPIILGYIFGASINVLTFYLINDSANKLIKMEPSKAKSRAYFNYFFRFTIYFIVLLVSALAEYLNLFGTFLGLNMVKGSIYILSIIDKYFLK
ncbi:ATP synthase subunit I [Tissierella sp. Yu-01]|uniref:ATP synthase subunit I n=1 Tax=Tissierella sp. Yu-01 TaxID=3035694 RepID=UPI00240DFD82|nr:ATP synthase subunit I [Tissierella sp. Yu-01]WFA08159.1 ATP synthase subunit I [Tissierella sp. Yu-01]